MSSGTSTQTVEVPERTAEQENPEVTVQRLPEAGGKTKRFTITLMTQIPG